MMVQFKILEYFAGRAHSSTSTTAAEHRPHSLQTHHTDLGNLDRVAFSVKQVTKYRVGS